MKRYSIMVRERRADHEVELCQCDSNPEALVAAAQEKYLLVANPSGGSRKISVAKYEHVYFIDRGDKA